jgi:trk system potassium uptake protein TrkA
MKIIIAGAGSVGRYMAAQLLESGHEVTLIDNDPAVARKTTGNKGVAVTLGDACELDTLARADAANADVVAAVTGDDEDNLVVYLLAKQEFGVPRVVARVNNPNNEWMFNDMWGVDVSVSTPHLLTALVEEAVNVGSFVRLLSLEQGKARISEVTLADSSPAIGRSISELGLPRESTIVALIRDGHVVVPRGDTALLTHDEVLVLTAGDAEDEVRAILVGSKTSPAGN